MKILVCEFFPAEGHVNLLINVCRLLVREGYEVIAVVPQNFAKSISICDVKRMDLKYFTDEYPTRRSTVKKTIYCLRVQKFISQLYKTYAIDATFVVTFDEVSLALGRFVGFIKKPTFIIHNLNPDDIYMNYYRRFSYNLIKKEVFGVVLAGYIKDFLVSSLNTDPDRVLVFPHPMTQIKNETIPDIDCVGISNSNDDDIIKSIIDNEEQRGLIKKNNLKVLLKSRKYKYDNGNLKVISGFVDSKIYDDYISRAKCIFIPFPLSFKYRVSGTLIDALSNNKSVIGTNISVITQSIKCYINVIRIYDASNFVEDVMAAGINNKFKSEDFSRFQELHSDELLSKILANGIKNALASKPMEDTYDF